MHMDILFIITVVQVHSFEDLVIERRPVIEWDDLFMEYDKYYAPNRQKQQIDVSISILKFSFPTSKLALIKMETLECWKDKRLHIEHPTKVQIPSKLSPWIPDTLILNSIDDRSSKTNLFVKNDGKICLKTLRYSTFDKKEDKLRLLISSFNNYGSDHLEYHFKNLTNVDENVIIGNVTTQLMSRESFDETFQDLIVEFVVSI